MDNDITRNSAETGPECPSADEARLRFESLELAIRLGGDIHNEELVTRAASRFLRFLKEGK